MIIDNELKNILENEDIIICNKCKILFSIDNFNTFWISTFDICPLCNHKPLRWVI